MIEEYGNKAQFGVGRVGSVGGAAAGMLGGAAGGYGAAVMPEAAPNVRPGVHDLMSVVENSIANADKAAHELYEALSAAGVLRAGAGVDYKKERSSEPAEAPMLGRLMEQQRQINDLARALRVLRDSLAF